MEETELQKPSTSKKRPRKDSSSIDGSTQQSKKKKKKQPLQAIAYQPIDSALTIPAKSKKKFEKLLEKAEEPVSDDENDNTDQTVCAMSTQAWKLDSYTHNDFYAIVTEEIALEGLDGITLEALWTRLSNTICQNLSLKVKEKAWEIVVNNVRLYFYELPEPRGKLVIFNRQLYVDDNSGHICDPDEVPEDIYPFSPIPEETATQIGVYGSCSSFDTRKDITDTVRQMNLQQAERLGNKLVITADQDLRNIALGLADCTSLVKLVNNHYCVLERIGRARRIGESSAGKCSLQQFADSKTLFYLRKLLLSNDLITKQPLCLKNKPVGNTTALFFHLKRFYYQYKPKKVFLIERVMEILRKQPDYRMEYAELKHMIGVDTWNIYMKKIIKTPDFKHFFNTNVLVPYRDIYPNAAKSEWFNKNDNGEKMLRVLQLINSTANVYTTLKEVVKEEQKDDSSDEEPLCESVVNASVYNQTFKIIYESGTEGLTHKQVQLRLGLDYYVVRGVLKHLTKKNFIYARNADIGRKHQFRYFSVAYTKYQASKTAENQEKSDTDALDFIAETLCVDKKHLRSNKPEVELEEKQALFASEYAFITAYRKKCRLEKFNIHFDIPLPEGHDLSEDEKKYKKILENKHGFYSMGVSVKENILKKVHVNFKVNNVFDCLKSVVEDDKEEGFTMFVNANSETTTLSSVDYQKFQCEVEKSKRVATIKFLKPQKGISQILTDYLFGTTNIDFKVLIKRFNECTALLKEQMANKYLEYPDSLTLEDEHDFEDNKSLVVNLEGDFVDFEKDAEVNDFKQALVENFEAEDCSFSGAVIQKRKNDDDKGNEPKKPKLDEPVQKIQRMEVESTEETLVDTFHKTYPDFKLDSYFKDKVTVNYIPPDKDSIETAIVHTISAKFVEFLDPNVRYTSKVQSTRTVDRTNFILDMLHKEEVISDIPMMMNKLRKFELQNKLVGQIDRKSLNRIIQKLITDGYMRATKIFLRFDTLIRTKTMISLPKADYTSVIDKSIEEMKVAFFIYSKGKQAKLFETTPNPASDISSALQEMDDHSFKPKYKQSRLIGRYYGHIPKCAKSKILHEFLFYLIYGHNGSTIHKDDHPKYMKSLSSFGQVDLYKREVGWTMFIPKLTCLAEGWCLYSDILLRMPITIFTKIFNVIFVIPELMVILNDPIKKNLLLKHLPQNIRNACFYARKYIFAIYECLQNLSYLGLLQFGATTGRKDEQPIYLNRNAILYDTTSSNPGYHQVTDKDYPKLTFKFETTRDVENYWAKVWTICLKTRLGHRYSILGQTITLHHIHTIPAMVEVSQPRKTQEAMDLDVGYIPGDRRGACGFDTNTWMGNKRNWVWHASFKTNPLNDNKMKINIGAQRKKHLDKVKIVKLKDVSISKKKHKPIKNHGAQASTPFRSQPAHSKRFTITRKIKRRPPVKAMKVPRYDEMDKAILKKLGHSRARFSEVEDDKLTMIDCALKYLFPMFKKRLISVGVIRDIMHRLCPNYPKQTSRAYNARILRKNKKVQLAYQDQCAYNLTEDKFVVKHFSKLRDRIQAGDAIPQEHLHIALIYLVAYTIDYYEKNHEKTANKKLLREVEYVDYLQDLSIFEDNSRSGLYNEPSTTEQVVVDTVKALIHGSFDCETKSSELYMLLARIYQTYSDAALKAAMSEMRTNQMIKAKGTKVPVHKRTKNENLQPTHMYTFKFVTKFPDCIFMEAFSTLRGLVMDRKDYELNPVVYEQGHGIGLVEICSGFNIDLSVSIPDEILVFNTSISEYSRFLSELDARYKRFLIKDDGLEQPKRSEALEELEELRTYLDKSDDKVNSNSLAYLLSKGLFSEGDEESERLEKLSKQISVVYPVAVFSIDPTDKELCSNIIEGVDDKLEDVKKAIKRDCVFSKLAISKEVVEEILMEEGANNFDLETAMRLCTFIEDKDVLGATAKDIKDNFENLHGNLRVSSIVQQLVNIGIITKLGILSHRFVYYQCINDWTVGVEYQSQEAESGFAKARLKPVPWLNLDISFNARVFEEWVTSVLSHCISHPFVPVMSVFHRFKFLKPVDLFSLLQYLQILGCVRLYAYENGNQTSSSLFSDDEVIVQRNVDILDDLDSIFLEMDHMAVVRLGAFLNHSHSNMSDNISDFTNPFKQ